MKNFSWKTFAELVGIAAIVASLIFVGFQMKQSQDIALSARAVAHVANTIELTNTINQHPDLWLRGIAGESFDGTDAILFENMLQAWDSFHFYASDAASRLGYESSSNYWATIYGTFLYRNPGARRWWEDYQSEIMDTPRLSRGPMNMEQSIDWYDDITHVWEEIERTGDLGSGSE